MTPLSILKRENRELRKSNQLLVDEIADVVLKNESLLADAHNWQRLVAYFSESKKRVMPPFLVAIINGEMK